MGELRAQTRLMEFTIEQRAHDVAEQLLALSPKVIGFGVYIWNLEETFAIVSILKTVSPKIKIVLGGPEVSYEHDTQPIVALADHVITGWGDVSFHQLCKALLHGPKPLMKIIAGEQPPLDQIALPYAEYSEADLKNRLLYVEASRGCPFKCEFCLSSLDKTAWPFDTDLVLTELKSLYDRGARHFKFVDRTFNLKIETSARILQFFLDRLAPDLFVHFEVIPDHLPDRLKELIAQFTPGSLQFEVGIQSFNTEVQARISRRADNDKTIENIRWLVTQSHAHVHADLIFGLPGESLESFAEGFDKLYATGVHEVQLGILKRLRGTPIIRHTRDYDLRFDPAPPYAILSNSTVDYMTVQRMNRFARYWDMIANSGRYTQSAKRMLQGAPFEQFMRFTDWLYTQTGKTHAFAHERLVDLLFEFMTTVQRIPVDEVGHVLAQDYAATGARGNPKSLAGYLPEAPRLRAQLLTAHGATRQARQVNAEIAQAAAAA